MTQWLNKTFDRGFIIILIFYFSSYWFFSYWVQQNHGYTWGSPFSIAHHPFKIELFQTHFWQTLTYMFVQSPLYSYFTWLMVNADAHDGFISYMILHHAAGFFALYALYNMSKSLKIPTWMIVCFLSYFVFNSGFYFAFSMGWNDYLSMCLVTYLAFSFMRLTETFTSLNLIVFFCILMILVSYRTLFSPITFFIPLTLALALIYSKHWKKILAFSLLPLIITIAPYVKNQYVFGSSHVGIGQFAAAFKATTYQWTDHDLLMKDIEEGKLSSLVLCFNKAGRTTIYQGNLYNKENCENKIIPEILAPRIKQLLLERPYLANPAVLQPENNVLALPDQIPNSLMGYVLAEQMIKDSKSFIKNHPGEYFSRAAHNLMHLFQSNTQYEFRIALNWRQFPEWFNQNFNLAFYHHIPFLKHHQVFNTDEYHVLIAWGMMGSLVYALLYAGNSRNKKAISACHLLGLILLLLIFKKRYAYFESALIWSSFFFIWGGIQTITSLWLQRVNPDDSSIKSRLLIAFMTMVSLYLMTIVLLVPSSEQERYRFAVEGLLIILFMFWINELKSFLVSRIQPEKKVLGVDDYSM